MTAALINRSLTNVRTELEFLYDSEVIDKALFDTLMESLPKKYAKDMAPWGIDKIPGSSKTHGVSGAPISEKNDSKSAVEDSISEGLKKSSLRDDFSPPPNPPAGVPVPERTPAPALGYCKASYSYESGEKGDLKLAKGDLLAVLEHLSPDWWKGYKKGSGPAQAGVFPSNYVTVISDTEFNASVNPEKRAPAPPAQPSGYEANASYGPDSKFSQPSAASPPTYQSGYQPQQQQQPSYGGYAQFPPPSTNYYGQQQQYQQPPQQYQQQPQQYQQAPQGTSGSSGHEHLKKFGGKLGNAAIFGAGATIGSDIVNSIF